jgi:uncharacterized protein YndB with AHSA1/START domain
MRALKVIGILVAVLIAGVLVVAAMQPDTFRIERSIAIKAPPEKVFAILEDFDRGPEWSSYEKKDPAMKRSRSGPAKGKGAIYAFEGNKDVGAGRLEITDAAPPNRLLIRLDMLKPFEASNTIEYTLASQGGATQVTQAMFGPMPFISKVMCLFFSMEKMVGPDFEASLAGLKGLAEKG